MLIYVTWKKIKDVANENVIVINGYKDSLKTSSVLF